MAYLPNKKVIFLIIFILLAFAGWFFYSRYEKRSSEYLAKEETRQPLTIATTTASETMYEHDTDGDGLKDWEELLWKTDPKNKDTDGDGTEDNEEIALNRSPLKAGPDDKVAAKVEDLVKENEKQNQGQDTLTAAYAKQFLTEYLVLKQQKGELTDADKGNIVESFMNNLRPLSVIDEYGTGDIKISNDSAPAVEQYAGEIKKIFIDDKQTIVNDSLVFENLFRKIKDGEKFQNEINDLNYSSAQYEELVKKMVSFPVPKKLTRTHLEAVNGFNNLKFALKNMALAPTDPIKAMTGRKLYDSENQRVSDAISNIQTIFDEYEIYVF